MNSIKRIDLIWCVSKREILAFWNSPFLRWIFIVQPFVIAGLMWSINRRLVPLLKMQRELRMLMVTRQMSTMLISFSVIMVLHLIQKSIMQEKNSGLIDTLLTTPLTVCQLVLGKAMCFTLIGYSVALLVASVNIMVLSILLDDMTLIMQAGWQYWLFAFIAVPLIVNGLITLVIALSLVLKDSRIALIVFTMSSTLFLMLSSVYKTATSECILMLGLIITGICIHVVWWFLASRITKEHVLSP